MDAETDLAIAPAEWPAQAALLRAIREQVFVIEQRVPAELEWDGADAGARHWLAWQNGIAVGTVRLLPDGHIGRMAVLRERRGQGIGAALLAAAVAGAESAGLAEVHLHAQVHAIGFYSRYGFVAEGPEFMDAGIPHWLMRRSAQGSSA